MSNTWNDDVIAEFRANQGRVGGRFQGSTLILLHTLGARSGNPHITPVMAFDIDDALHIAGSYAGSDANPAWLHNLRANPHATIEIGTHTHDVIAHELPRHQRDSTYARITAQAPVFADYQAKTQRAIPVIRLTLLTNEPAG